MSGQARRWFGAGRTVPSTTDEVIGEIEAALVRRRLVTARHWWWRADVQAALAVLLQGVALYRDSAEAIALSIASATLAVLIVWPLLGQRRRLGPRRSRTESAALRSSAARPPRAIGDGLGAPPERVVEAVEHFAWRHERTVEDLERAARGFGSPVVVGGAAIVLLYAIPGALQGAGLAGVEMAGPTAVTGLVARYACVGLGLIAIGRAVRGAEAIRSELEAWRRVVHVVAAMEALHEALAAELEPTSSGSEATTG